MQASYLTLAAILLLSACTSPSAQQRPTHATVTDAHTWHMKRVTFKANTALNAMPEWGITARPGRIVDALAMLIPVDWTFQPFQARTKQSDCNFTSGRIGFLTFAPDKSSGLIVAPGGVSVWSNDRGLLQSIQGENQQFAQNHHCNIEQPQPLAARIDQLGESINKDIQITGPMEPIPGLSTKLPAMIAQANAGLARQAAQSGTHPATLQVEAGRIPTRTTEATGPADGYFAVMQVIRTETLPNGATLQTVDTPLQVASFTPAGKYTASEPMFTAMLESVVIDPDYQGQCNQLAANLMQIQQVTRRKLNQIYANMAADNANAFRQQQAIRAGVQDYSNQVHASVAANRSAAFEHSNQQFALSMGDQAIYHDPSTGHNVQMSNQYSHAWASTTGNTNEYILTDSPSYNPNGQAGSAAWTQLQPVH